MNKAPIVEARSDRSARKPAMQSPHVGILAFVGRALKIFSDRVGRARRMHREYEALLAMSDRELNDIGITRADIPAVVARTYCGARPVVSNVITLDWQCGLRSPGAHNQSHGSLQLPNRAKLSRAEVIDVRGSVPAQPYEKTSGWLTSSRREQSFIRIITSLRSSIIGLWRSNTDSPLATTSSEDSKIWRIEIRSLNESLKTHGRAQTAPVALLCPAGLTQGEAR